MIKLTKFMILSRITALTILVFSTTVYGQDYKQVLKELKEKYKKMEKVHIVMLIQAYEKAGASSPYYQQKADVKRQGTNYMYKFANNEMLMNNHYLIMVDKESKEIICGRRDTKAEKEFLTPFELHMDSLTNAYGVPEYIGKSNEISHYRFKQKGDMQQVDLFVNTEKAIWHKVEYRYSDGQFVVIDFQLFDMTPQFKTDEFNEQKYVVSSNGKLKGNAGFQNYNVVSWSVTEEKIK